MRSRVNDMVPMDFQTLSAPCVPRLGEAMHLSMASSNMHNHLGNIYSPQTTLHLTVLFTRRTHSIDLLLYVGIERVVSLKTGNYLRDSMSPIPRECQYFQDGCITVQLLRTKVTTAPLKAHSTTTLARPIFSSSA